MRNLVNMESDVVGLTVLSFLEFVRTLGTTRQTYSKSLGSRVHPLQELRLRDYAQSCTLGAQNPVRALGTK